jgi:hypothetical protein
MGRVQGPALEGMLDVEAPDSAAVSRGDWPSMSVRQRPSASVGIHSAPRANPRQRLPKGAQAPVLTRGHRNDSPIDSPAAKGIPELTGGLCI